MKFRSKSVVIEATQLLPGESLPEGVNFGVPKAEGDRSASSLDGRHWVQTLEGPLVAKYGDWIITGTEGERYPCKPSVFAAKYEPVLVAEAGADPMLQFFDYAHLPPALADVSRPFCQLAGTLVASLPRNPERTAALRTLLEAKDCAERALHTRAPVVDPAPSRARHAIATGPSPERLLPGSPVSHEADIIAEQERRLEGQDAALPPAGGTE
jgi:hypothetical protein